MTFYVYLAPDQDWRNYAHGEVQKCKEQWWYVLLFVNNVFPWDNPNKCMSHFWYIANDMQFFFILPFQLLAYKYNRFIGYIFTLIILIAGMISIYFISSSHKVAISLMSSPNYGTYLYILPWTRISAYQVGVIFGMWYYEYKNRDKISQFSNSVGTCAFRYVCDYRLIRYACYATGLMIYILIAVINHADGRDITNYNSFPQLFYNIFNMLARPLFVSGIAMILMGPLTGKGRLLRKLLHNRLFDIMSRL